MLAGVHNFTVEQGSTWSRVLHVFDGAGASVNLAGYTARMHVRRDVDEPTTYVELTSPSSGITISGHQITLALTASQTAALARSGVYDLEVLAGGTTPYKLLRGEFRVILEVTR